MHLFNNPPSVNLSVRSWPIAYIKIMQLNMTPKPIIVVLIHEIESVKKLTRGIFRLSQQAKESSLEYITPNEQQKNLSAKYLATKHSR